MMKYYLVFLVILFIPACTGLNKLPKDERLYTGASLSVDQKKTFDKEFTQELSQEIKPSPNKKFLWIRPALSIYNFSSGAKKEKGFKSWLNRKFGKPPVLLRDAKPKLTQDILQNRLFHSGYFNAEVTYDSTLRKKTARLHYTIYPNERHAIDTLSFPREQTQIAQDIRNQQPKTLIVKDTPYDLDIIKNERIRIDNGLKDSGYFYFQPDFLLFNADSSVGNNKVKLDLKIKQSIPNEAFRKYTIGNIYLFDDYQLEEENSEADTTQINGVHYISRYHAFRPEIILNSVDISKDSLYSHHRHMTTFRQLMSLGVFKYGSIRYLESDQPDKLDAHIHMTTSKKYSLSTEFGFVSKSSSYAGPGAKLTFRDRNFLRGAEELSINFRASLELQLNSDSVNTSYELAADATLKIPRMLFFNSRYLISKTPETFIRFGTNSFHRVELYTMNKLHASFGYSWQRDHTVFHQIRPFDISYLRTTNITDVFDDFLNMNPNLRRSFENQFIFGTSYEYTYDKPVYEHEKLSFWGEVETAGNVLSMMSNVFNNRPSDEGEPVKFLGVPFAQYVRLRADLRKYFKIKERTELVGRLEIGIGLPYGNSTILPNSRQFFVGGTNSLRAFVARSIGPGSYNPPDENISIDQTGDIKLESNIEYRFGLSRLLRGAFFLDAGNIWLLNEDQSRPGSAFSMNKVLDELAIGSGFGLRIDADFIVVRLDLAFPLKIPYRPAGDRWVLQDIRFFNRNWRKDNLMLNFAIGYPF